MSSVVARKAVVRRESLPCKASVTPNAQAARRQAPLLGRRLKFVVLSVALLCVFSYVSLYAVMTALSFDCAKLTNDYRQEQIQNERLRIEYARRTSPAYVIAWAQSAGMVYAKEFEYLNGPDKMAKARQSE